MNNLAMLSGDDMRDLGESKGVVLWRLDRPSSFRNLPTQPSEVRPAVKHRDDIADQDHREDSEWNCAPPTRRTAPRPYGERT